MLANPEKRVVVFVSKKMNVHGVTRDLRRKGFNVAEMHSDLEQREREEVINAFKSGRTNVLVATDIVSRGIDITGIQLVVNYDMPHDNEDYVHRVGRTARADADGESATFVSANNRMEMQKFARLEQFLGKTLERIEVPQSLGGCDVKSAPARTAAAHGSGERRRGRSSGAKGNQHSGHSSNRKRNQ